MRILIVCPTIYPEKLEKMNNSLFLTKSKNTHVIYSSEGTVTEAINNIFYKNPDYDFYFIANDDIVFNTPLWDLELIVKGKISWGSDGIQNGNLPCFPMIDGDIVRALGWLQLPTLNRYCGDTVLGFIGKECGILNYCPNVSIKHKWHESQVDRIIHLADMAEFAKWLPWSFRDCANVRKVICQK